MSLAALPSPWPHSPTCGEQPCSTNTAAACQQVPLAVCLSERSSITHARQLAAADTAAAGAPAVQPEPWTPRAAVYSLGGRLPAALASPLGGLSPPSGCGHLRLTAPPPPGTATDNADGFTTPVGSPRAPPREPPPAPRVNVLPLSAVHLMAAELNRGGGACTQHSVRLEHSSRLEGDVITPLVPGLLPSPPISPSLLGHTGPSTGGGTRTGAAAFPATSSAPASPAAPAGLAAGHMLKSACAVLPVVPAAALPAGSGAGQHVRYCTPAGAGIEAATPTRPPVLGKRVRQSPVDSVRILKVPGRQRALSFTTCSPPAPQEDTATGPGPTTSVARSSPSPFGAGDDATSDTAAALHPTRTRVRKCHVPLRAPCDEAPDNRGLGEPATTHSIGSVSNRHG